MLDVAVGTIFVFICLALIGLGPTLLIFKAEFRVASFFALSPVVGLILTTIFGTYFVLMDYPVLLWGVPWLIVSLVVSLIISFWVGKRHGFIESLEEDNKPAFWFFIAGLLIVLVLALAPMIVGGLDFTVLRGNGTDDINYMTMAGYLFHEPYSQIFHSSIQTLIDKHPTYALAQQLLTTRWSTSMLLAWCFDVTHVPLYRFEYGFTALFFIITYGVAFEFALKAKMPLHYVALLAIAVCVGFWGQFVLDTRAMSQISVLPVLLLFVFLLARIENQVTQGAWREYVFLGIVFTSIVLLYVEITSIVILGSIIFLTRQMLAGYCSRRNIIKYSLSLITVLITILPAAKYLSRFFAGQATYALHGKNDWYKAFFPWLYHQPISGFWGLVPPYREKYVHAIIFSWHTLFAVIGLILFIIFIATIARVFFGKKIESPSVLIVSIAFMLAAFIEFIFLLCNGQLWAAGKGLSYGYPFIYTTVVMGIFTQLKSVTYKSKQKFFIIGKHVVLIWLVIQCVLGVYRIAYAKSGDGYLRYMSNTGGYRQHDWKVDFFMKNIKENNCGSLGLDVANAWYAEYLAFVFGWDVHVINLRGVGGYHDYNIIGHQKLNPVPTCLIIDNQSGFLKNAKVLDKNSELSLIKSPESFLQKPYFINNSK
jgi:hypothetical protein